MVFDYLITSEFWPIIISLKINLFLPWYIWKIVEVSLNNNHSLTDSLKSGLIRGMAFGERGTTYKIMCFILQFQWQGQEYTSGGTDEAAPSPTINEGLC
jgi:hypothetical protein